MIRKETGNFAIHHVSEEEIIDFNDLVYKHLLLPLQLLFLEPIVFLITIYTAFIYGILYLYLEATPIVFAQYRGINEAVATLPYIGLIIGVLLGCGIVVAFEPRYNRKLKENNGIPVPEQRLLPMMASFLFLNVPSIVDGRKYPELNMSNVVFTKLHTDPKNRSAQSSSPSAYSGSPGLETTPRSIGSFPCYPASSPAPQ